MKKAVRVFIKFIIYPAVVMSLSLSVSAASAGAFDTTFGTGGKVTMNNGTGNSVSGIAVQTDGKIIVVGAAGGGTADFLVLRYNANGSLDTTFDTDGIATTDFSGRVDRALDVAIQTDGKIVVVGYSNLNGFSDTAIARYLPNGSLDTNFDGDGRFLTEIGGEQIGDIAQCIALQADGKIVAGGGVNGDFSVLRLNLDGSLDTGFNGSGFVTTSISASSDVAKDIVVQPDGKIVAGGSDTNSLALARYNANGTLDTTFGTNGVVETNFDGFSQGSSLAIAPGGKLVAAGNAIPTGALQYRFAVARYNSNGSLDTTFSSDGKVVTNINSLGSFAQDVTVQSDGKIIASGYEGDFGQYNFSLVRYNLDGTLDESFGNAGIVKADIAGNDALSASSLVGDKLIAAGDDLSDGIIRLARYNLSAVPTSSTDFDGDGFADYAVFRPASATWFVLQSSSATVLINQFGVDGDTPVNGDFDGDQKTDFAIFRSGAGQWWINRSSDGQTFAVAFGQTGDKPSVSDYDKDGRTDIALWRPSNGNWYVLRSSDNFTSFYAVPFGQNGDILVQSASTP
jgi:uncharacterized delta-60 repeat protein